MSELAQIDEELAQLQDWLSDGETDHPEDAVDPEILKDFSTVVVVDNLPKIPISKFAKLKNVIERIYNQIGTIVSMDMPSAENKKTLGFAFIEFKTAAEATKAVTNTNGWALDKRHVFNVNHYADVDRYLSMRTDYREPQIKDYQPYISHLKINGENLRSWLADPVCRDQYVVRYAQETEIHWFRNVSDPTPNNMCDPSIDYAGARQKDEGKNWCEMYVAWSPNGTYLATFHHQGVALWGGSNWKRFFRFAHTGVQFIEFSPNENYLVTWNGQTGASNKQAIIVWDLNTGVKLRSFSYEEVPTRDGAAWPAFKWSHDDTYAARMGSKSISVFGTQVSETMPKPMTRVGTIPAAGITEFSWSPSQNVLCYWAPEMANTPAKVALIDVDTFFKTKLVMRQKNLYSVVDCKVHWHPQGSFLCVQVTRHTKTKKRMFTNFEIFRMQDKDVPVEMFELRESVSHFAWEPEGVRFAVVHSNNETKANVSFYTMDKVRGGEKLDKLYTLEDKACNRVYWSPIGRHCVLAGQQSPHNGVLEFFDADEEEMGSLANNEHFMCTDVQWDPSGRIVASVVCQPLFGAASMRHQLENGYCLWSFQGVPLYRMQKQNFYQFEWRPRPISLLTEKERQGVLKNMKEKRKKYEDMDKWMESSRSAQEARKRLEQRNEFHNLLKSRREKQRAVRAKHIELLGWDSEDDSLYEITTETIEELIETKEEASGGKI